MTLDQGILKYKNVAEVYKRNAKSKGLFNPEAAEEDRGTAREYEEIVKWLEELRELRKIVAIQEVDEIIRKAKENMSNV